MHHRRIGHEYLVREYKLPMRAIGRGLRPLQRRSHYPFTVLSEIAEHADGDARRKQPVVELQAPTLVVSYSPPTLRCRPQDSTRTSWC